MVRSSFQASLEELQNDVIRMGSVVEKQINKCVKCLVEKDIEQANEIIKDDDIVDRMEKEIDDKAIKLIAVQQPLATDLRSIFIATKITSDLERIADLAVDVVRVSKKLKDEEYIKKLIDIPRMCEIALEMLREALDAFVHKNVEKAYEISKRDDEIDALYKQIFNELLVMMIDEPKNINQSTQFLFVARYLERVGDHITNICEWVIYLSTGDLVDLND